MATGRKTVVVGQTIDPDTWGNLVWDQSVQQFASDADRTAQFPIAARKPGAVTWLDDLKVLQVWNGTAWISAGAPWQAPALAAGISDSATLLGPRYQVLNGAVNLVGAVNGTAASTYTLFTLPVGARPTKPVRIWATAGGYVQIGVDGIVNSTISGVKADVAFDGIVPLT
jgi:hypothetical protein